jgi:cystathionine beta-lyase
MTYDFETLVDRSHCGAAKWDGMRKTCPDLPEGIVPFSVADMEFKNAPEIMEGLKEYLDTHILGYTNPTEAYFASVCMWMKEQHGWQVDPDHIVCSPGVVPALYMLVAALTEPTDGIIIMPPVYHPFQAAAEKNGRPVKNCPLIHENGTYEIDFDLLEKVAAQPDSKLLIFCNPHNPVGRVWTKEDLAKVGEICVRNNVIIVSDEIHSDIMMPGFTHTPFPMAGDFNDQVIVCTAPSKTFNLAAMQTSNIIIPNKTYREKFLAIKETYCIESMNALGFEACRLAYTKGRPWMQEMIAKVYENYRFAVSFFEEHLPMLRPAQMQGTYLMWLDCTALGLDEKELETLLTEKARFFAGQGYTFGEEGKGFERINLACPTWVLKEALERLEKAIKG